MKYKYKVLENADDPKDILIEKSGVKVKFSMRDFESAEKHNASRREEIETKAKVERAKMENILHNYPFIKDMEEKDMNAVYMYYEALQFVTVADEKVKEFDEHQKEIEEEVKEIYKQIPEVGSKVISLSDLEDGETKSE